MRCYVISFSSKILLKTKCYVISYCSKVIAFKALCCN